MATYDNDDHHEKIQILRPFAGTRSVNGSSDQTKTAMDGTRSPKRRPSFPLSILRNKLKILLQEYLVADGMGLYGYGNIGGYCNTDTYFYTCAVPDTWLRC